MKKILEKLFDLDDDKEAGANVCDVSTRKEELSGEVSEIIIVSDNHRTKKGIVKILTHYANADCFLHCGDSNLEPDNDVMRPFITVRGNTDYQQGYGEDEFVELMSGERIWITHGHRYAVNSGTEDLVRSAKSGLTATKIEIPPVDIILYGHTHRVDVKMQEGILVINPGSIARPRDGVNRTYARLLITDGCYDVQILDINDHSVLKELRFPRE